ncbi:hypothetical protein H6S82_03855 [Planktothrix sp. FACHB-1355]|uniref:Uncharacterized protein n=1 Tax=Aerosakkonema funiforme FACHB-1375 TaxID=2949571 RepID=A0A926ZKD3_9CYAN|nr:MULTISPECIES: hypothetical protein [Oscillatoriales]MBD2185287.1 hypothetical protein [Aerosakkonema funiforme FACHB-1375]MBD3557991.1 hypothetical protein [Planktothrix sp. FACHB-1355]
MNEISPQIKLGVLDFIKMIYNGHPEYSLIAVKASIDDTVQAFIEFREGQQVKERRDYKTFRMKERKIVHRSIRWEQNIPIRRGKERYDDDDGGEEIVWGILFLQVYGSEWTVILRSLCWLRDEIDDVPKEAKSLSTNLQTKAITLMEGETTGYIGYELLKNGELLEKFEHDGDDEDFYFESKLREKPDIHLNRYSDEDEDYNPDREYDVSTQPRNQFVDAFFRELGIYLPACYPVSDDGKPTLAFVADSENTIERADWVSVEEKLENDRIEADPDDAE